MLNPRKLGILLIIASGLVHSTAQAQIKRAVPSSTQQRATVSPAKSSSSRTTAKTPKSKTPTSKPAPTRAAGNAIDVFELGETPTLDIVEVVPVDFETEVPMSANGSSAPAGASVAGEEWVVGGGGVPTGTYLENGRWVNDGDVINEGPLPEGAPEQYQTGPYDSGPYQAGPYESEPYQLGDMQGIEGTYESYGLEEFAGGYETMDLPPQGLRRRGVGVSPLWVRGDALVWSFNGMNVPALVSTSAAGTNRLDAGVLGVMGTSVLLGNKKLGESGRGGARIEVGGWLPSRSLGWHVAYFGLDNSSRMQSFSGDDTMILARPFYSVEPNSVGPNAELISFPNQLDGSISAQTSTSFDGAEIMLHRMLAGDQHRQIQFVGGYQYNSLNDDIRISDFKRITGGSSGLAIGTTLAEDDRFQTSNRFNGATLGVLATMRRQRLSMEAGMQMALGNNHVKYFIDGSTTSSVPVTALAREIVTTPGGLLTQASNLGTYEQDTFTMIPQLNFDLGYNLYPRLRLLVGYRFMYWSQVARAGDQIDTRVNLSQLDAGGLSGEARPEPQFRLTDFWAQGLNVGLDFRF